MSSGSCKRPPQRIRALIRATKDARVRCAATCTTAIHAAEGHEKKKGCVKRIPVLFARRPSLVVVCACTSQREQPATARASEPRDTDARSVRRKEKGATARPRQRKVGVSGAIDVARHPRRPLNFRSLVTLSSLAQKSLSSSRPSPLRLPRQRRRRHPLSFSRADESLNVTASAIFLSEHRRARACDETRRDRGLNDAQTGSFQLINVSTAREIIITAKAGYISHRDSRAALSLSPFVPGITARHLDTRASDFPGGVHYAQPVTACRTVCTCTAAHVHMYVHMHVYTRSRSRNVAPRYLFRCERDRSALLQPVSSRRFAASRAVHVARFPRVATRVNWPR